jgi:hypothetical protein
MCKPQGLVRPEGLDKLKKIIHLIQSRTRDLPQSIFGCCGPRGNCRGGFTESSGHTGHMDQQICTESKQQASRHSEYRRLSCVWKETETSVCRLCGTAAAVQGLLRRVGGIPSPDSCQRMSLRSSSHKTYYRLDLLWAYLTATSRRIVGKLKATWLDDNDHLEVSPHLKHW